MAMNFGQGLIQSLINPGYGQGLFTAGQAAGQIAAGIPQQVQRATEQKRQQERAAMQGMLTAAQTGELPTQVTPGMDVSAVIDAAEVGRDREQADLERQTEKERLALLRNKFVQSGGSEEAAAALDAQDLSEIVKATEQQAIQDRLDRLSVNQQRRVLLGMAAGAPESVRADIQAGVYDGEDGLIRLNDELRGKGANSETFQYSTGPNKGQLVQVREKDGLVDIGDGVFRQPSSIGLIEAPTITAESSVPDFISGGMSPAQAGLTSVAFSSLYDFVDETPKVADVRGKVGMAGIQSMIPGNISTDYTATLKNARNYARQSLGRVLSGAQIRRDENKDFDNLFNVNVSDYLSPQLMALKIIRTGMLLNLESKVATGSITPERARQLYTNIALTTLSDKDKEELKKGNFQKVVKGHLDRLSGGGVQENSLEQAAMSIVEREMGGSE